MGISGQTGAHRVQPGLRYHKRYVGRFCFCQKEGGWLPLNRNGRELLYHPVERLNDFKHGFAIASIHSKYSVIQENGEAISDFIFDNVIDNENGTYWVAGLETPFRNGKSRVIQAPYTLEFTINTRGEMVLGN